MAAGGNGKRGRGADQERKKGVPWTEEEHNIHDITTVNIPDDDHASNTNPSPSPPSALTATSSAPEQFGALADSKPPPPLGGHHHFMPAHLYGSVKLEASNNGYHGDSALMQMHQCGQLQPLGKTTVAGDVGGGDVAAEMLWRRQLAEPWDKWSVWAATVAMKEANEGLLAWERMVNVPPTIGIGGEGERVRIVSAPT
ncbi:hypothetical protein TRIUR3_02448 [Triticum urartu]|uniref:Uncharacterized protein n=1 Tax=Triticum urartu TaxID=4572 RepID=M7YQ06_TRIUA|nr:hypothetical protein TRIUR3_02448 [Triticum urartu]